MSTQPIIINDPSDPSYGPSANNSIQFIDVSNITITTLTNGNGLNVYSIPASYFPLANTAYRITINWAMSSVTFATAVNGNLSLTANINGGDSIGFSASYARSSTVSALIPFIGNCLVCELVSTGTTSVDLYFANDAVSTITTGSLTFKNIVVETITSFIKP